MATLESSVVVNNVEVAQPLDAPASSTPLITPTLNPAIPPIASEGEPETYFKNISIPIPDGPSNAPQQQPSSVESQGPNVQHAPSPKTSIFGPNAASTSTSPCGSSPSFPTLTASHSMEITPSEVSIDDSSSRVAVRIVLKKSKRFCGAIRLYLNKSAASNCNKLKSLVSGLKDWFKNGNQLTSSLMKTFKGQSLSQCLRFLGLPVNAENSGKRKKPKRHQDAAPKCSNWIQKFSNGTLLNLMKKPELPQFAGFEFTKPKVYQCGYCDTRFYKMPVYLKHIRRHAALIKCESCNKAFSSSLNQKRHQMQCRKRKVS